MNILKNIESAVKNTTKLLKIQAEIIVADSLIELTVKTKEEAVKLKTAFSKSFNDVEIFDLSEIEEKGFMLNIRF